MRSTSTLISKPRWMVKLCSKYSTCWVKWFIVKRQISWMVTSTVRCFLTDGLVTDLIMHALNSMEKLSCSSSLLQDQNRVYFISNIILFVVFLFGEKREAVMMRDGFFSFL